MKVILAAVIFFASVVIALGIYLTPNDLANCPQRPTNSAECKDADAVIAISGGDTGARTREAIKLYENGWATKLIFSGAAQDKSGPSNAQVMAKQAIDAGVPESSILTEEYSETTKQNAEKTESILYKNDIKSVILVTSAYHQRRAGLEFAKRAEGVDVRNHPVNHDKQWSGWWWLTPSGWFLAVSEFVKIILFYAGVTR